MMRASLFLLTVIGLETVVLIPLLWLFAIAAVLCFVMMRPADRHGDFEMGRR